MKDFEVVLPKRVVQQTLPPIYKHGDCSACVLAGLTGLTVEEIYTEVYEQDLEHPKPLCWPEMVTMLNRLYHNGEFDRVILDIPYWHAGNHFRIHGDPDVIQGRYWFDYVTMALDAGYYGIVHYNMKGQADQLPNHWVLVVGARRRSKKIKGKAAWDLVNELLISCSSTKTKPQFWLGLTKMLRDHGGFNILLARPKT